MYKYIDMNYLKEVAEGDNDFIIDMVDSFLFQTPDFLEQLAQNIVKKDWAEVERVAHKIKPTVQYVGLNKIEDKVKLLHTNAKERTNLSEIPVLFGEINEYIKNSYPELQEVRDNLSGS